MTERATGKHPHFDGDAVFWHTRLADALVAARATGKLVFVEFGRAR
jgi:hypothetical protein